MNDLSKVKIGFFGTPLFALRVLKQLKINFANIKYVVTQRPKPSGRGQKTNLSAVNKWSDLNGIKVFNPNNTKDPEFIKTILAIEVDFIVVVAYGHWICEEILNYPKYMSLNVHASLLPLWRGAAPIQRSILNGDKETGVSIMRVDKKLDSGPVISKKKIKIESDYCSGFLHDKLSELGSKLIILAIKEIFLGTHKLYFQNEQLATYANKITKEETKIIWNYKADYNQRFIRAFNPWPGAWTNMILKKKFRIKILESEIINDKKTLNFNKKPGFCSGQLIVKCKENSLKILKLQKEGKKIMSAEEFLNGSNFESCFLE
ncbi:methionyl-tRNA formyltransferase [Rickettsiales bacterium]|nr:methionyl-tRNA formyltransferase [Rickettsiales bacterium]